MFWIIPFRPTYLSRNCLLPNPPCPPLHKGGMTSKTGSWFHSTEHSKTVVWREANSLPYGRLTPNS